MTVSARGGRATSATAAAPSMTDFLPALIVSGLLLIVGYAVAQPALAWIAVALALAIGGVYACHKRDRALAALQQQSTEQQQTINEIAMGLEHSPSAILFTSGNGTVRYLNQGFAELLGANSRDLVGVDLAAENHSGVPDELHREILDAVGANLDWHGEVFFPLAPDGGKHTMTSIRPIFDGQGQLLHVLVLAEELSNEKVFAQRLFMQANYDPLTGLPNRKRSLEQLQKMVQAAERKQQGFTVIFFNLDRFKLLNDSLGPHAGDKVLVEVAKRLQECVSEGDTVGHLGGDKYMLLLRNQRDEEAARVALHIKRVMSTPVTLADQEITITTSFGMSTFPEDGKEAAQLLQNAETAMYIAKQKSGNQFYRYRREQRNSAHSRLTLESQLRQALQREELNLFYQPVIALADNRLCGAEVLLRWENEELGNPRPDVFIAIAEESGLILPIGEWVLQQACHQAAAWHQQGMPPLRLAVNTSVQQFNGNHLLHAVEAALESSGIPPSLLELEVTERLLMAHSDKTRQLTLALKDLGLRLSLDDFGTGYSSLSYLRQYPFDVIKIDRSFIRDIKPGNDSSALARAIIAMARSLEMEVVAEGVEYLEQRTLLKDNLCDMAQGFLFAPPMSADHFESWVRSYQSLQN